MFKLMGKEINAILGDQIIHIWTHGVNTECVLIWKFVLIGTDTIFVLF